MTEGSRSIDVERCGVDDVVELRVRVLRRGTPVAHANYSEDADPGAVHFCVRIDGEVVATSTWIPRECPERRGIRAVQLKGMAVEDDLQGSGLGRRLIDAGVEHSRRAGSVIVWARARDSALGFYVRCGFEVVGEGFIDEPTAMPHHIVVREIVETGVRV